MASRGSIGWWGLLLCSGLALLCARPAAAAEPVAPYSASAVRAAFLLNFAKFTEWPDFASADAEDPVVFGVVDDRELEDALWRLTSGQRIQGHPIRVRRILAASDLLSCHVVYFGAMEAEARREWLQSIGPRPILTVASEVAFLTEGGLIRFFNEGQNLRFEIQARRAQEKGLVLSSRLLALSRPRPEPTAQP